VESDVSAVWNCHHCQWSGSVGGNYARREAKTYRRPPPLQGDQSDKLMGWFFSRGISEATVKAFNVQAVETWMPGCESGQKVRAIAFPFTRDGDVINVKYRTVDKRFRQEKDAEPVFFGLDQIGDANEVVVCEGEIDAMSFREVGIAAVSVPDGAPAQAVAPDSTKFDFFGNCAGLFAGKKIVLATDADGPGRVLEAELARRFGKARCRQARYPEGCKDANEVLKTHGGKELRDCIEYATPYPLDGIQSVDQHTDAVLKLYRNGKARGLSTGWPMMDDILTVRRGDVWVVTGVPNHGKSEWLDALAVNLAETHGFVFGLSSFENQPDEHIAKIIEKHVQRPFWDGPTPRMSESQVLQAMEWADRHFRFVRMDDEDAPTIDWLLDRGRELVERDGISGFIIDPYNEIQSNRGAMSETDYVSQMLGKVRRFSQSHEVATFFVAHPQKMQRGPDGNYQPPSLYDISGSANWNNKADVGVVVHRDFDKNLTEVFVRKVRRKEVGRAGTSQVFTWMAQSGRFLDVDGNSLEVQVR
jgi:twinkle protein